MLYSFPCCIPRVLCMLYDVLYFLCCINLFVLYACCKKWCVVFPCCIFMSYFPCCIFVLYFLCCIFRVWYFWGYIFRVELSVYSTNALLHIGRLEGINHIASFSGWLHWNKLCSFCTRLKPATYKAEIIKARLYQCTKHRSSCGKNNNYSPLRNTGL